MPFFFLYLLIFGRAPLLFSRTRSVVVLPDRSVVVLPDRSPGRAGLITGICQTLMLTWESRGAARKKAKSAFSDAVSSGNHNVASTRPGRIKVMTNVRYRSALSVAVSHVQRDNARMRLRQVLYATGVRGEYVVIG